MIFTSDGNGQDSFASIFYYSRKWVLGVKNLKNI